MTVSAISGITQEGQPLDVSSFIRSGVVYVVWHDTVIGSPLRRIRWKPHTSVDYTEVIPTLSTNFTNVSALYDPVSGDLVVVWDDGTGVDNSSNGKIYSARFNPVTGALLSGPTNIFPGTRPKLCYLSSTPNGNFLLYYKTPKNLGVYGRRSEDGGLTWKGAYPLVTGQVTGSTAIEVTPYDDAHVSIAQVGNSSRTLGEIGVFSRTRPLASIIKHPTVANQFFIGEPSKLDNVTLTDNLRGSLVLATDNSKLYHLDGVVQGTSDGINAVALITVSGTTISVTASAGPTGNGDDINSYTLTPASGALNVDLPNASCAVGLAVSAGFGYIAEYTDNGTLGQFVVVDLNSGATGTVLSGLTGVRGVAVANFLATPLIFVATTESGVERIRVYQQNALTPTLFVNAKLTSRANYLTVGPDPTNPTGALLYASLVDRLNIYRYKDLSTPLLLIDSLVLPGGGSFFQSQLTSSGHIVVAAGNAGVLVLDANGAILAQTTVSGEAIADWTPAKAYVLNNLVKPRAPHQFARSRYYFKNTTAGTSGNGEPLWAATGTIIDSGAQWQPVGLVDGVAVGVAVDESTSRIYAVGSAGGNLGTDGRVWILKAAGLL
jgi:hypothetical protein